LTKVANFINAFITNSETMANDVVAEGIRGTIKKAWHFIRSDGLPDCSGVSEPARAAKSGKALKIRFREFKLKPAA